MFLQHKLVGYLAPQAHGEELPEAQSQQAHPAVMSIRLRINRRTLAAHLAAATTNCVEAL